jgi:hypothetical protein
MIGSVTIGQKNPYVARFIRICHGVSTTVLQTFVASCAQISGCDKFDVVAPSQNILPSPKLSLPVPLEATRAVQKSLCLTAWYFQWFAQQMPTAVHKSLQYSAPTLNDVVDGFLSSHKGQSTIDLRDV